MTDKRIKIKMLIWIYWITLLTGIIDVYSIKVFGMPTTHHTGNSSNLALTIYENDAAVLRFFLAVFFFFLGSFIAGLIFYEKDSRPRPSYGNSLIIIGAVVAILDIFPLEAFQLYIISICIGMQNGMFMKYKGALIRTSHVTGSLTDAGFALGAYLRGEREDIWKVRFYILSVLAFIAGGILGYLFIETTDKALLLTGFLYVLSGLFYLWSRVSFSNVEESGA